MSGRGSVEPRGAEAVDDGGEVAEIDEAGVEDVAEGEKEIGEGEEVGEEPSEADARDAGGGGRIARCTGDGGGACMSVCVLLRCQCAEEHEGGETEDDVGERSGGGDEARDRRSLQRGGRD